MKDQIKKLLESQGWMVTVVNKISETVYSAIVRLPGGTVENFRCELDGSELKVDTW